MGRSPADSGDKILDHHTKAIMELFNALNRAEEIRTNPPKSHGALFDEYMELATAADKALKHIEVAEGIRKQFSPRTIAALEREANKDE